MAAKGIVDDMPASQKYPYPTSEQPNNLTDEDLRFLSLYTSQKDLNLLREHVIKIWRSVKDTVHPSPNDMDGRTPATTSRLIGQITLCVLLQLWVYRCIQELMFLQPRIPKHPLYPEVKDALLADKSKQFLVNLRHGSCQFSTRHDIGAGITFRAKTHLPFLWISAWEVHLSALMQDLGCCFGQDTRQLILDGISESSISATDITPDYWFATQSFCLFQVDL